MSSLAFICPHCHQTLQVAPQFLGKRGTCNKCGGHIALIGRADAQRPQMASQLHREPPSTPRGPRPDEPTTPRQQEHLARLGVPAAQAAQARTKAEACRLIEAHQPPPTKSQLAYLARLGATPELLARVQTKAQASALIERILALP